MIVLKKLLLEHPDNISYRGNNYDYSDGIAVFSVFRNQNTKKWVGVTLIETENERLVIKTTDDEVNKSLQYFNDKNYSDYAIHPHIMSSLSISGLIRRVDSAYAYRNARPDIPVNGRVWYVNDKSLVNGKRYLISFWNGVEHFNNFDREIEGCLELAGVEDINQCLFEFIDRKNQWLTYSEVTGKEDIDTAKDDEETIKQLLKIQHINPKAKSVIRSLQGSPTNKLQKAADKLGMSTIQLKQLLGRDIAENQLQENPDGIIINTPGWKPNVDNDFFDPNSVNIEYTDHQHVVAVICIGEIRFGKGTKMGWIAGSPDTQEVYMNEKYIGRIYSDYGSHETHDELMNSLESFTDNENIEFDYIRGTHARLYEYRGIFYISFWEISSEAKKYSKEIQNVVEFFTKNRTKNVMVQFDEMGDGELIPFEKAFKIKIRRTKSKEKAEFQKALHLMTPNRKAELLKKLGAMKPNNLQKAADKFGMTTIELRQLLGMDIAEGRIEEDPDNVVAKDGLRYTYNDSPEIVKHVFTIGNIESSGKSKIGWLSYNTENKIVYHDGEFLVDQGGDDYVTHSDLRDMAFDVDIDVGHNRIDGRIFEIDDQYYLSVWEPQSRLKFFKHYVEDMLKSFDIDPTKVKFQCKPMSMDMFISYDEMFGVEKVKSNKESEKKWELQKQIHLLPPDKKAELLKKLGAMKPNNLQKAADKFGMTVIELRQALGMDIAENSLGNLSFSDYHDPSIPYEAKPRISIVPRYGTMFEKFSRKHKKKL